MKSQRIPLVGSLIDRGPNPSSFSTYDQRFVNCFPEVTRNAVTGGGKAYCTKRPGSTFTSRASANYAATAHSVLWTGRSTIKAVFTFLNAGTSALEIIDDGGNFNYAISNVDKVYSLQETSVSGAAYLTIIARKTADSLPHAWYVDSATGTVTEITDVDYPSKQTPALTTVGEMVHLDGYAFVMDSKGQIWNSDLNSLANWTATNFITANLIPDAGAGLARTGNILVGFGTNSLEFFQNTGNAVGSPLTRIVGAGKRIGARPYGAGDSPAIMSIGDAIYFVGTQGDSGTVGIYRVQGTTVTKISNPAVDKLANEYESSLGFFGIAGAIQLYGMTHVLLATSTATCPAYCIETNTWWTFAPANSYTVKTCCGYAGSAYMTISGNSTKARGVYTLGSASPVYSDDSSAYDMIIQTQLIDNGTARRKFFHSAEIIGDVQSVSGNLGLSWSDNDYLSFGTARNIDTSNARQKVTRLGSGRRRSWRIQETVGRAFRAEALEVMFEEGET